MASLVRETGGRYMIQLSPGEDPKRGRIRLGKMSKREAETARGHIARLARARRSGEVYPPATADWLARVPVAMRRRLEAVGLVDPQEQRSTPTLAEWVSGYIAKRVDGKPNTIRNMKQAERCLMEFFGTAKRLDEITAGDAEDFRLYMKGQGLAESTIRRRCKRARQFMTAAIKADLLTKNPFADIACGNVANLKRMYYVTREEAEAVLAACPDAEWRLIFGLARYGGLRVPSEILALRWGDIDWAKMRFTVNSSKTEHHSDGGMRQVPIFAELALKQANVEARPGGWDGRAGGAEIGWTPGSADVAA